MVGYQANIEERSSVTYIVCGSDCDSSTDPTDFRGTSYGYSIVTTRVSVGTVGDTDDLPYPYAIPAEEKPKKKPHGIPFQAMSKAKTDIVKPLKILKQRVICFPRPKGAQLFANRAW